MLADAQAGVGSVESQVRSAATTPCIPITPSPLPHATIAAVYVPYDSPVWSLISAHDAPPDPSRTTKMMPMAAATVSATPTRRYLGPDRALLVGFGTPRVTALVPVVDETWAGSRFKAIVGRCPFDGESYGRPHRGQNAASTGRAAPQPLQKSSSC
jgi:hypothetical protein